MGLRCAEMGSVTRLRAQAPGFSLGGPGSRVAFRDGGMMDGHGYE